MTTGGAAAPAVVPPGPGVPAGPAVPTGPGAPVGPGVDGRVAAARLERASALLLRRLRPTRPGDLTRSQSSLLDTVREHGPLSMADLARRESVQAPTASRAVELLVQRGLLRRHSDPVDHRRQVIELDDDAAALLEARSREAVRALATTLDGLADTDRATLLAALPVLEELVGQL